MLLVIVQLQQLSGAGRMYYMCLVANCGIVEYYNVDDSPFNELADTHCMHDRANSSGQRAARLYQETFLHRRHPNRKTLLPLDVELDLEHLSLFVSVGKIEGSIQTLNVEELVLGRVGENPGVSTRQVATDVGERTIWRMLHEQCLYP